MSEKIKKLEEQLEKEKKLQKEKEKEMLAQKSKTLEVMTPKKLPINSDLIPEKLTPAQELELIRLTDKLGKHDINLFKKKLSWLKIQDYPKRFRLKFRQHTLLICHFELNNRNHSVKVLPIVYGRIWFRGGCYVVNPAFHYYNVDYKNWCGDFHQGYNLQIERRIPVGDITKTLQTLNPHSIGYASDPITLKTFQINEIAKTGIQAAGISDFFKQVRLLVIISAISSTLTFLLYAYSQGYFSGITGGK